MGLLLALELIFFVLFWCRFMTNGILLNECNFDKTLSSYSAIILDESHERVIEVDILLGCKRNCVKSCILRRSCIKNNAELLG